ncbi:MAG: UDP-N-acetylmuramoyl-L-alanine--D-glutamate ligase, partial [Patescibacteria group bacterium]
TSQTEIFFDNFPGTIIGVTGTKGKGTTVSLIYAILKKAGLKVFLGGNIGAPVLQYLLRAKPNDILIYELSSHQLQGLKKSPHIAVFLNLFRDHLDYYQSFNEYKKAKENIAIYQTKNDYFVYAKSDKAVGDIAKKTKAKKLPYALYDKAGLPASLREPIGEALRAGVNPMNLMAAISVAELFKISKEKIKQGIKAFKPLPHRLNFAGKFRGIEFYDDSMATIPEATMAALDALGQKVKTLIVGGSDKGSDYNGLAKKILKSSVENLIILGQGTGEKITKNLDDLAQQGHRMTLLGKVIIFNVMTMKGAVKICYEKTPKNSACLLSPASASFNLFRDYHHRGMSFRQYVRQHSKTKQKKA